MWYNHAMTKACPKHPSNVLWYKSGQCAECAREYSAKYRQSAAGKANRNAIQRKYSKTPTGREVQAKARAKFAAKESKESLKDRRAKYRSSEEGKARRRAYALWSNRLRRKNIREALPKWADTKRITQIYLDCPPGYHVDHIIPLRGIDPITKKHVVCGLHVHDNLGYLPADDNGAKWAWFSIG